MPITLWGNPILDRPSLPMADADFGPELAELKEKMLRVMRNAIGAGLAAPQVGIAKRFFVYDCDGARGLLADPVIVERSRELQDGHEGCLSVPGFDWPTLRAERVLVEGRDEYGDPVHLQAQGYLARCMQHEVDHLDGSLYLSRLGGKLARTAKSEARKASWFGQDSRFVPA